MDRNADSGQAEQPIDGQETLAAKIWREVELVGCGALGFTQAAERAVDHPLETGGKLALSAAVGLGLGYMCRSAGVFGLAGRAIGASMGLAFFSDVRHHSIAMTTALGDNWSSARNWDRNVALMKDSLGQFTFDTALMSAGALSGSFAGRRLGQSKMFAPASEVGTYGHLMSELKSRALTESHLANAARPENLLGVGGNASVYRLPSLDSYVLRVPRFAKSAGVGSLEPVPDILPGTNVGQPVARMGDWTVLKAQSGVPAGGPIYSQRKLMGDEAANKIALERIKAAAEMPQSAFDDFAQTLKKVESAGLQFDPSKAGNVLIDAPGRRFNVVDISPTSVERPYRHSVSDMVITLMDNASASRLPQTPALQSQYRAIVEKSLKAAERYRLPVGEGSSFDYSLKLAGLKAE